MNFEKLKKNLAEYLPVEFLIIDHELLLEIKLLVGDEKIIFRHKYVLNKTHQMIAGEIGVTSSRIWKIHKDTLNDISKQLLINFWVTNKD